MARVGSSLVASLLALSSVAASAQALAAVNVDTPDGTSAVSLERSTRHEASHDELGPAGNTEPTRAPESISLGARAFMLPTLGVGGLGLGLDEAYSLIPNLAVGGQYLSYIADQGADPQYCERCILDGKAALVFAEGRAWPDRWLTPYARVGGGLSFLNGQRVAYERGYGETDFTLLAEAGVEAHYRWFSTRAFGFHLATVESELDRHPLTGFGTQLAARF